MAELLFNLDNIPLNIDRSGLFRQMGYPDGAGVSSSVLAKVQGELDSARHYLAPRGAYMVLERENQPGFERFPSAGGMVLGVFLLAVG